MGKFLRLTGLFSFLFLLIALISYSSPPIKSNFKGKTEMHLLQSNVITSPAIVLNSIIVKKNGDIVQTFNGSKYITKSYNHNSSVAVIPRLKRFNNIKTKFYKSYNICAYRHIKPDLRKLNRQRTYNI